MQVNRDLDGNTSSAIQAAADVQRAFVLAVVAAIKDESILPKVGESLRDLKPPEVPAGSPEVPGGLPQTYRMWFEHERQRLIEAIAPKQ